MPTVGGTLMRQSLQPARPAKPDSRQSVIAWFKQTEMPRGVMKDNEGKVNEWFHGILTRGEAENLLNNKEPGTFLVRVSEKIWGYTISVKANDRSVFCEYYRDSYMDCYMVTTKFMLSVWIYKPVFVVYTS
jgi:hypothetical protein